MSEHRKSTRPRFFIGTIVFIIGFLSPLLIPFVTSSNLNVAWKTGLSGLLAFGIPELFILIAVAIMGKDGYHFLKSKIGEFLKPFFPPQKVSLLRYRIGLVFFCIPLVAGWLLPYLSSFIPEFNSLPIWSFIIGDAIFLLSFFILGGEFWDKFRSLFYQEKEEIK